MSNRSQCNQLDSLCGADFVVVAIGSFVFENATDCPVTVNSERYRDVITNILWQELQDIHLDELSFQQDFATCHTIEQSIDLVGKKINNNLISQRGD